MNVNTKDLVELATSIVVWLGSEEPPKRINSELAMSPSNLEIEMYLQDNVELRNLALELDWFAAIFTIAILLSSCASHGCSHIGCGAYGNINPDLDGSDETIVPEITV